MTLFLSFSPFLQFCSDNGIVLLADEVYQRNVYTPDKEFLSAKKVALETSGCEHLQLISFHSTSKGLIGEYYLNDQVISRLKEKLSLFTNTVAMIRLL